MCYVCKSFKKNGDPKEAMVGIKKELERGVDPEHFDPLLDQLLGTGIPEVDEELEVAWEEGVRGGST